MKNISGYFRMKKIYSIMFFISVVLTLAAIVALVIFGLRFGVDFKGGSVLEIQFLEQNPSNEDIQSSLSSKEFVTSLSVQPTEKNGSILRFAQVSEEQHRAVLESLQDKFGKIEEKRFDSVGPVIGQELRRKSVSALIILFLAIVIYIAFAFRRLGSVLSPWAMGAAALIALIHDVGIPLGVFAILGHYYSVEISAVFVAAILTILGYSISDSVVVFDRIRENVLKYGKENFGDLVHKSVMQTLTRSLNTTFTTLLSLFAIYFFGGQSVKMFSLALIIGVFLGAYSSIFIASPLLFWMSRKK